jgi:hypothetical protein
VDLCTRLTGGGPALLDPCSPIFAEGLVDVVREVAAPTWRGAGLLLCDPVRTYLLDLDRTSGAERPDAPRVLLVDTDDPAPTAEALAAAEGSREVVHLRPAQLGAGCRSALRDALLRARLHGAVLHAAEPGCPDAVAAVLAAPLHLVLGRDWRPHVGDVAHEAVPAPPASPLARARASHALATLAQRVELAHTWDDLVLPAATMARLRELSSAVSRREQVFGDWGFRRSSGGYSSLRMLFTGESGTGKTMSAAVVAHEAGLELFQVDVSAVVSKYIGETEKNLERIFRAAEGSDALLFFDEADALFGKRSEVSDAHDRYANIEASYLLQRVERYDGVLVLATNLAVNMDEAFSRRIHGEIEFPLPDEAARKTLWRKAFPRGAPLGEDVDAALLAAQFPLTGGEIRNIALAAAFLAAHERTPIEASHVMRSIARQRHRQGKLPTFAEFGEYLRLVRVEGG